MEVEWSAALSYWLQIFWRESFIFFCHKKEEKGASILIWFWCLLVTCINLHLKQNDKRRKNRGKSSKRRVKKAVSVLSLHLCDGGSRSSVEINRQYPRILHTGISVLPSVTWLPQGVPYRIGKLRSRCCYSFLISASLLASPAQFGHSYVNLALSQLHPVGHRFA